MAATAYAPAGGENPTTPRRGRPSAASREEVLALASQRLLDGQRLDIQSIAAELGVSRATVNRCSAVVTACSATRSARSRM